MPGETTTANLIPLNIAFFFKALFRQIKGYVKLMVMGNKVYRYPDLVVIHQKDDHKKYVTDSVLIV